MGARAFTSYLLSKDAEDGWLPLEYLLPWPKVPKAGRLSDLLKLMVCKTFEAWCFAETAEDLVPEDRKLVLHADLGHVRKALQEAISQASKADTSFLNQLETSCMLKPKVYARRRAQLGENGDAPRTLQQI